MKLVPGLWYGIPKYGVGTIQLLGDHCPHLGPRFGKYGAANNTDSGRERKRGLCIKFGLDTCVAVHGMVLQKDCKGGSIGYAFRLISSSCTSAIAVAVGELLESYS